MLATKLRMIQGVDLLSCEFIGSHVSASDLTTYTFSSVSLGDAAENRYIVVGVGHRGLTTRSLSSVTIGGVSATAVKTQVGLISTYRAFAGLVIAAVPTGATGNVVVTWSGSVIACGIGIWRLTGLQSATPTATASDSGDTTLSASLTIPSGGCGIGYTFDDGATGTPTCSWTNLTENFDGTVETSSSHSGAMTTTAGTADRTATWTSGAAFALALAAWN